MDFGKMTFARHAAEHANRPYEGVHGSRGAPKRPCSLGPRFSFFAIPHMVHVLYLPAGWNGAINHAVER
jgi:hypothetical protein